MGADCGEVGGESDGMYNFMETKPITTTGQHYVYELRDECGVIFYVGKGQYQRINCHEWDARRGSQSAPSWKIRETWERGFQIQKVVVFRAVNEDDAYAEEKRLIAFYGRTNLTNLSDGDGGRLGRPAPNRLSVGTIAMIGILRSAGFKWREIADQVGVSIGSVNTYKPKRPNQARGSVDCISAGR